MKTENTMQITNTKKSRKIKERKQNASNVYTIHFQHKHIQQSLNKNSGQGNERLFILYKTS